MMDDKEVWTFVDLTNGSTKGYYQIQCNGVRVCDAFPFAPNVDAGWLKDKCEAIVHQMNEAQFPTLARTLSSVADR